MTCKCGLLTAAQHPQMLLETDVDFLMLGAK